MFVSSLPFLGLFSCTSYILYCYMNLKVSLKWGNFHFQPLGIGQSWERPKSLLTIADHISLKHTKRIWILTSSCKIWPCTLLSRKTQSVVNANYVYRKNGNIKCLQVWFHFNDERHLVALDYTKFRDSAVVFEVVITPILNFIFKRSRTVL